MGEVIYELDFTVASIHAGLEMDDDTATKRMIRAVEDHRVIMIGHPTGRLLLRRTGYNLNMEKFLDACARNKVIIEINAHPQRLDLAWEWARPAWKRGILLAINPDAHDTQGINDIKWGVSTARKAGLPPDAIINTWDAHALSSLFNEIKKFKNWKKIVFYTVL